MEQILINGLFAAFMALMGFILRAVWQSIKDLQSENKSSLEKLNSIEVLVVGNYVTKTDMDRKMDALFEKLDRIELKLDRKVDK